MKRTSQHRVTEEDTNEPKHRACLQHILKRRKHHNISYHSFLSMRPSVSIFVIYLWVILDNISSCYEIFFVTFCINTPSIRVLRGASYTLLQYWLFRNKVLLEKFFVAKLDDELKRNTFYRIHVSDNGSISLYLLCFEVLYLFIISFVSHIWIINEKE